jgi:hypothetical protein
LRAVRCIVIKDHSQNGSKADGRMFNHPPIQPIEAFRQIE